MDQAGSIFASPDFWASWREECRQIAAGTAPKLVGYEYPIQATSSAWTDEQKKRAANSLIRGYTLAVAAHAGNHTADELRFLMRTSGGRDSFIGLYGAL